MLLPRLSLVPSSPNDHSPIAALEVVGEGELPDIVLTAKRREELRAEVRTDAARLTRHEKMYKAGAYEVEANAEMVEGNHRRK